MHQSAQSPLPLKHDRGIVHALVLQRLATQHSGRAKGVRATVLASALNITERGLRDHISQAREDGVAVAGTPETGYFIATTAGELEEACRFLRSRAMHSLHLEARMRQVPLPELLGQLHLST